MLKFFFSLKWPRLIKVIIENYHSCLRYCPQPFERMPQTIVHPIDCPSSLTLKNHSAKNCIFFWLVERMYCKTQGIANQKILSCWIIFVWYADIAGLRFLLLFCDKQLSITSNEYTYIYEIQTLQQQLYQSIGTKYKEKLRWKLELYKYGLPESLTTRTITILL